MRGSPRGQERSCWVFDSGELARFQMLSRGLSGWGRRLEAAPEDAPGCSSGSRGPLELREAHAHPPDRTSLPGGLDL